MLVRAFYITIWQDPFVSEIILQMAVHRELGEKLCTGHDHPRHLWTNFKVTLNGHCIRSWQHQSSHDFKWVSSGSRASGWCNIKLLMPGPAIRVGNFWDLLYFQLLTVTISKFFVTSKNKVKNSGTVWHARVPIPSFVVNVVGEIDCYKPNPLTIHRKWCILHSNLSHPRTKITIFRGI